MKKMLHRFGAWISDPVIGIAVEPKTQKDLDKLSVGLAKLAEEDPTFTVRTDEQTGQTIIISGMGEPIWISLSTV